MEANTATQKCETELVPPNCNGYLKTSASCRSFVGRQRFIDDTLPISASDANLARHVFAEAVFTSGKQRSNVDLAAKPCDARQTRRVELNPPQEDENDQDIQDRLVSQQDYEDANSENQNDTSPIDTNYVPLAFGCLTQQMAPRSWCLAIITNRFSMMLILVNCITLGMYRPCEDQPVCSSARCFTLAIFDHVIFCFFTLEMLVKVVAMGLYGRKSYLDSPWNRLDAAIVVAGLLEYCVSPDRDINLTAIRGVRVLRPLRAINRIPSLRILVTLLLDTLPMLGNVLLLCFFVFFIFGIMGVQLWQSVLRNRCMMNDSINALASSQFGVSLPLLFQSAHPDKEFICSRSADDGMQHCSDVPPYFEPRLRRKCNLTIEQCINSPNNCSTLANRTLASDDSYSYLLFNLTDCINWNHYYDTCAIGDKNPFLGAISFDNIGFAWVAIFQVISLEAWVDILYAIQDASTYWSFVYFVALIVIGSFFMINLCLVVIATQFSDTKKRETERIRQERLQALSASTLTVFSDSHGLYRELVKLVVHLLRKLRRKVKRVYRDVRQRRKSSLGQQSPRHKRCSRLLAANGNDTQRSDRLSMPKTDDRSASSVSLGSTSCTACTNSCMLATRSQQSDAGARAFERANIEIRITSSELNDEENFQVKMLSAVDADADADADADRSTDVPEMATPCSDLNPTAPRADPESDCDPFLPARTASMTESSCVRLHNRRSTTSTVHRSLPGCNTQCSTSPRLSAHCSCPQSRLSSSSDISRWRPCPSCNLHTHTHTQTGLPSRPTCRYHQHQNQQLRQRQRPRHSCQHSVSFASRRSQRTSRTWKRLQARLKLVITHRYAQRAILTCILLNTLSMGMEHYNQPQALTDILEYSNLMFTTLFAVEMLLKLAAYGVLGYVSNIFNVWDSVIVILSVLELAQGGATGLSVLRTFRLLRILKLVRFMPALRRQLVVMLRTMDNVTTFLLLLALFMFIFSVLGMNLFGCKFCDTDNANNRSCYRKNFDSLLWASITVFQVLTQEDWNTVLYLGMSRTTAWASLYFVALMTFGNYVLFNLLVAILVEGFATDDRLSLISTVSQEQVTLHLRKHSPSKSTQFSRSPLRSSEARDSVFSSVSRCSHCSRFSAFSDVTSNYGLSPPRYHCGEVHRCRHDRPANLSPSCLQHRASADETIVLPVITTTQATPKLSPNTLPRMTTILVTSPDEEDETLTPNLLELLQSDSHRPTLPFDPDNMSFQSIDRSNYSLSDALFKPPVSPICNGHLGDPAFDEKPPSFGDSVTRHASLRDSVPNAKLERLIDNNLLHPQMCLHASFRLKRLSTPVRCPPVAPIQLSNGDNSDVLTPHREPSNSVASCPHDLHYDCRSHSSSDSSVRSVFAPVEPKLNDLSNQVDNDCEEADSDENCCSDEDETSDDELDDEGLERKVYKEVERAIQEQNLIENDPAAVGEIAFDVLKFVPQPRGCFKTRNEYSLYVFSPENSFRKWCLRLVESRWFETAVLGIIVLNCIALACEKPYHAEEQRESNVLDMANYIFTIIFGAEMLIKVIANNFIIGHKAYMSSCWNRMDGILVIISVIDFIISVSSLSTSHRIFHILRVFRLLRTLRPLRVINRAPGLKLVVQTLLSSLRPIGNIVLICCAFFVIFGILGVQLFKGKFFYCDGQNVTNISNRTECERAGLRWVKHKYNFDNLGQALMTLFVLASKDGWVNIMYQGLDAVGEDQQPIENYNEWRLIYFISFLLIVGFFVISMFVGVIVDNFNRARHMQMTEEKTRRLRKRIQKLRQLLKLGTQAPYWQEYPKWRLALYKLTTNKYFDLAVAAIIGLNVITMALEFYLMPDALRVTLDILNYCFTCIFVVEGALKIVALGFIRYIRDRWNQLDLAIIVLSATGIVLEDVGYDIFRVNPTLIRVFRVLRIARVLKLLKMAKGIRELLDTVVQALPQVGNLGLLFFLLFFIFAALGVELFGGLECSEERPCVGMSKHANFHSFANAFLTLFRIATGDNWNGILKDTLRDDCNTDPDCETNCCVSTIAAPLFFVVFVLIAQFVLVNVVIAVLMRHLEDAHRSIDDEDLIGDSNLDAGLRADLQAVLNDLQRMNINKRRKRSCIFPALPRIIAPPLEEELIKAQLKNSSR